MDRVITITIKGLMDLCHTSSNNDQIIQAREGGPKTHDVEICRQPNNHCTVTYKGNIITSHNGLLTIQECSNSGAPHLFYLLMSHVALPHFQGCQHQLV